MSEPIERLRHWSRSKTIVASAAFLLPTSRVLWWDLSIMKNIDIKSIIIGALLTSTIFLGVAATSQTDKWDKGQRWEVGKVAWQKIPNGDTKWVLQEDSKPVYHSSVWPTGWEPISYDGKHWRVRKRVK